MKDPKFRHIHLNPPASMQSARIIERIRIENGLTQKELGKKMGWPQATIARLENGAYYTGTRTLEKIAGRFGYNLVLSLRPIRK